MAYYNRYIRYTILHPSQCRVLPSYEGDAEIVRRAHFDRTSD